MTTEPMDALVIFGVTGDLAKLETFPALVGLVDRGVLDVPVVGVAKSGWEVQQLREYATASLRHNGIDPSSPAAVKLLGLLRYVDGDLANVGQDVTLPGHPKIFVVGGVMLHPPLGTLAAGIIPTKRMPPPHR